jgi:predicted PurR-regulated permease PerM
MTDDRFRKAFLLALVIAVSAGFLITIRSFLLTIVVAAIFAGLAYPLYSYLLPRVRGSRPLASALTLLLTLVLFVAPLVAIFTVVVQQAIRITTTITPVVQRLIEEPTYVDQLLQRIPGIDRVMPYRDQILTRAGDIINTVGTFLVGSLSGATRGTVNFVFHAVLLLYTMFFLLMDGPAMLRAMLAHLPLRDAEKEQMKDRFLAMTRATIKGTIVIAVIQGSMSGVAFWAVGIPDSLFWGVVMVVLSILPVIGGALVWVPACIILAASGQFLKAALLAGFCSLVVGSVDNVLRPRLVGRDTKMHDLVILFSTLGGIITFGPIGFIVGPILAGLFVTSWEIFAVSYRTALAEPHRIIAPDSQTEQDPIARYQSPDSPIPITR